MAEGAEGCFRRMGLRGAAAALVLALAVPDVLATNKH